MKESLISLTHTDSGPKHHFEAFYVIFSEKINIGKIHFFKKKLRNIDLSISENSNYIKNPATVRPFKWTFFRGKLQILDLCVEIKIVIKILYLHIFWHFSLFGKSWWNGWNSLERLRDTFIKRLGTERTRFNWPRL